jgi:hypothetical protein
MKIYSFLEKGASMKVFFAIFFMVGVLVLGGCEGLRFSVGDLQKQNAWVHRQTAEMAVDVAEDEDCSAKLLGLTRLSERQSEAFVFDYGLPAEPMQCDSVEEMLGESNFDLADSAAVESVRRPDVWDIADSGLELAIGISALLGGIYGTKAVSFLQLARVKSAALKEIVEGNELLKNKSSELAAEFKAAQAGQSAATKQIVAEVKS